MKQLKGREHPTHLRTNKTQWQFRYFAYCWLIRSLKAQGMNELATNELAAAKEHLTTEEYEEILAFGANW